MGDKETYATKEELERLATRMHKTGILYSEAVREFEKQFIVAALKTVDWNRSRAAKALGMHRNTVVRKIREFGIDVGAMRTMERKTPRRAAISERKKIAG